MPFIGSVGPKFFLKNSMEEVAAIKDIGNYFDRAEYIKWKSFRDTDDSRYVGLVMPRVLGRLPYGPDTVPVTGFKHLSSSRDEARYEVRLEPRMALLTRSRQNAIYQNLTVPQIVEKILRERHQMRGQDFVFNLKSEYPAREQVMQYGEDDLTFVSRLLSEVGIWFRFATDARLKIEVIEFYDDQSGYERGLTLPLRHPSWLPEANITVSILVDSLLLRPLIVGVLGQVLPERWIKTVKLFI